MKKQLFKLIYNREWKPVLVLMCLFHSLYTYSESYTLSVGDKVTITQEPYAGGYIDKVGLADFIDPHLSFTDNYDGSATITVNSYFDYTAVVKLVFIERYQVYYNKRYHTRAATYYKDVSIKCNYEAPQPNVKPTKVLLPERVRVPLNQKVDIYPVYEPYGAKGTEFSWYQSQGTAVFSYGEYDNGGYHVTGRSPGLGNLSVKVDNDDNLRASTIIEVVDPEFLPPDNVFLPSSIEISVGGHATLEPILVPEGTSTSYTWTSDDSSIASVNYGKVTGVKVGTTTITVKTANELQSTCKVTVVSQNGKDDEEDADDPTTGTVDGYEFVDLGLSVKWATVNVGATKPEEYGNYYAWGETTTKSTFSWSNYKYGSGASNCTNIGSNISGTQYDAAYVNWGSCWRMPTKTEYSEMISKCQFEPFTENGVKGYKITGPNGNSIFLPIAGVKRSSVSSECRYWASNVNSYGDEGEALLITTKSGAAHPSMMSQMRFIGIPIRAVTESAKDIEINVANFPDENFRNYLLGQDYGADGKLTTGEINQITEINVSGSPNNKGDIKSLKGIEYFIALKTLYCSYNHIASLDVSKNTVLKELSCYSNQLTALDVSKNTTLTTLSCGENQLTALDVSKNTALTRLDCEINQLTSLDVSKNTALTRLYCSYNQLTALDVSKNTSLIYFHCYFNQLITLDVSKNTALTKLFCSDNQLTALDVSKCTSLQTLNCHSNQLTALDVSKCTSLLTLYCHSNQLTALDVSKNTTLDFLYCYCNQIRGTAMDNLIDGLPINTSSNKYEFGVISSTATNEGNVCTTTQVAAAKAKGWTPMYYDGNKWTDYEGCDPSDVKVPTIDIDADAPIYNLSGQKLATPQKGINIIGGKKVVIK